MTIATPLHDGFVGFEPPDGRQADLFASIIDPARLGSLRRLALLDTPAEQAFDRLTRLAVKIFHVPVALLSLVDGERSFFKSSVGLAEPWASRRQMPLSHSVCQHVVAMNAPLIINDARAHRLICDNLAVAELRIVAYLGIPLVTSDGHALGSFAVIDTVSREWTPDDVTTLGDLAASAMTEIELRAENNQRMLLQQRLHLLESVVGNAAAVLIAEADKEAPSDLRIVFVNDSYTRLTGYSPEDVVGKIHQVLNSSETDRTQLAAIQTAMANWKSARLENHTYRKDGSAFWAESNIVPITDITGRYSQWVIIQRDISAQKAAEEALRESEERFRVLTEAIPQIVWTAEHTGSLDYYNQRWYDYTGLTLEQSRGQGWQRVVHPEDLKASVERWAHAVQSGETYEIKYRFKRAADGTYRWHLGQARPVRDPGGRIVKWFGTCTDITELKHGEQLLAAQYACTRIIAASVVMNETIPKILQAMCEQLGWTLGQMWQMDPEAGLLRCVASYHAPNATVAGFVDLSRTTTFPPGIGLPGRVWATQAPSWLRDLASDVNFPRAAEAMRCGLSGAFAFPILHGEKVCGVMEFFHVAIDEPGGPLLATVASVGSQVGQFMERMRIEEARKQSEERYRSFVLTSSQVVWIADGAGQLLLKNSADWATWLTFTGQTADQAQGEGWLEAIHPADRARAAEAWAGANATKGLYEVEYRLRTTTGEYRHTVARGVPVMDAGGQVREWVGSNTDITERKRAEESLKEANQQLETRVSQRTAELSAGNEFMKALLENIQNGIVACDAKGNLTLLNQAVRKFHGLTEQPIDDQQFSHQFDLYHADAFTPMTPDEVPLARAFRGERLQNLEIVIAPKGGRARTVLASGRAFYDAQENKLGAVISLNDITERKRAEAELLKVHEELEQRVERRTAELALAKEAAESANRAKSEFFSRMSHELRTPLNVILGFGQLLELDALSDSQRESAEQIIKGGRHLLTLVNEVLDIARIEAGGPGVVSLEEVDVGEVISDVLAMVQPLANQAGIRLAPPNPEIVNWAVHADLQRLKQVLLNLLSNAIKYNRKNGKVAVSCTETAHSKIRISVTDTGHGIASEKMHRLFAAFDRLEAERNGVEGTGLGLTLSKGLVEAMKGTMGVESTVGHGSTFWVELARIEKTVEFNGNHATLAAPPEEDSISSGTVLCVEDNPANFRLIERILKLRPGVRLLSATQGRLGIELARQHLPDLVFLDLHLPDVQGDEVLRQLQNDAATRDIPVIILSADATPNQAERLCAAGARRYMVKPLDVKEFLQILDETLLERKL